MVRELLGSVGPDALLEATAALHERRAVDSLRIVDRLSNEGKDLGQFVGELISHLRNVMLLPHAPEVALAEVGAEERRSLEEQANNVPTAEVVRLIETLGDTLGRIKRGGDPKLELELSFLKLTRDYVEPSVENLLRRLEALEIRVEGGVPSTPRSAAPGHAQEGPPQEDTLAKATKREAEALETDTEQSSGPDDVPEWDSVLQDLKDRRKALAEAVFRAVRVVNFDRDVLELEFPEELESYAKDKSSHAEELSNVLESRLGVRPRLEFRVADGESGGADAGPVEEKSPRRAPGAESRPMPGRATQGRDAGGSKASGEHSVANGPGRTGEEAHGRTSGEAGGDDVIRDQREVFEMARERFGSRDPNGGSQRSLADDAT
jgi:DNA polymerase-3 subunit gamma/tau